MVIEIFEVVFGPVSWMFQLIERNVDVAAPAGILILGLVTGLRHSFEADHVAAVSTMVASSNGKLREAPILGAMWGLGHSISLLIAGLIVLLFAVNIPEKLSGTLELGVGIMLILLGLTALTSFNIGKFLRGDNNIIIGAIGKKTDRLFKVKTHTHPHIHHHDLSEGEKKLVVRHNHEHDHATVQHRHSHKSLIVGMIHGMAGSGALMLMVLSTISSIPVGLAYIALFGTGSIAGMIGVSTAMGLSFRRAANLPKLHMLLRYAAAIATTIIGSALVYELALIEQVFLP